MRPLGLAALAVVAGACSCETTPGNDGGTCDPLAAKANLPCDAEDTATALRIVRSMSLEEKVQQMSGPAYNPNNMFDQEDNARLDIPGFKYMDGPRGVRWYNSDYGTTVYPVAAARASSWNVELEQRIGKAMADEMRYLGRHVLLAPTINQVTHPRWGRAQESYGEDSYLLGEMGAAFITGAEYPPAEGYRVQSCVKHFAANNIEDTRIYVNAVLDDRTLREVYLPHFQKAVAAGTSCVMASYNRLNGSYNGYSKSLIRDILKTEWKFPGFVITDWFAKGNTQSSPVAGLDIEMPFSSGPFPSQFDSAYFYGSNLISAVNEERVDAELVDEAAARIIHSKVHHGTIAHAVAWTPYLTKSEETQALSLEAARQGVVLLKNEGGALPLPKTLSKVFVVGKFANSENMGDKGSSDAKVVDSSLVVTPYEGISEAISAALPSATVKSYVEVAGHEAELQTADAIVVVAAYFYADLARSSSGEEGEWKDRVSMQLPQRDLANISAAVALKAQKPALKVVVVMKSGGAIVVKDWVGGVDALLMAWFGGMKEGTALAEILFGDVNPSGKLCQSFPVLESDLPAFPNATTGDVTYDYYHGYRWLNRRGVAPQYAFGFGLSYTRFEYSNLVLSKPSMGPAETIDVSVDVKNAGSRAGSEVVQLYVGYPNTAVTSGWGRPVRELKAFARAADLAAGETRKVTLRLKAADLAYWDGAAMTVEPVAHEVWVGPSSAELPLHATFTVEEPAQ